MTKEIGSGAGGDVTPVTPRPDDLAAQLRGFGPVGILAIVVIFFTGNLFVAGFLIPAAALLVFAWAHVSNTPWREIGYSRPRSWLFTTVAGLLVGAALKLFSKAVLLPLVGAEPINQAYHHLAGNRALIPATLWSMMIVGLAEETVFRGFLFERLGRLLGTKTRARVATLLITSVLFGAVHYFNQGLAGVEQATIIGVLMGRLLAVRPVGLANPAIEGARLVLEPARGDGRGQHA
jgi:membrane protease YdiL (CAAX protease family)